MGALNLPSASDLERLTRRLRGVSQRLEALEDGLDRLEERIDGLARSSAVERAPGRDRGGARPHRGPARSALGLRPAGLPRPGPRSRPAGLDAAGSRAARASSPARCSAARSASASIRARVGTRRSETISSAAACDVALGRQREQGRALHLHGRGARPAPSRPASHRGPRRTDRWRRRGPPAPRRWPAARPRSAASAARASGAPSARLVPSAASAWGAAMRSPSAQAAIQRATGPHADQALRAEVDQLGDDDRRARAAHARALDGQRLAVVRRARIAPQTAVVVEHRRGIEQRLGEQQRSPGIAGEQDARRQRRGRDAHGGSRRCEVRLPAWRDAGRRGEGRRHERLSVTQGVPRGHR